MFYEKSITTTGIIWFTFCNEPQHHTYDIGESSLVLSHVVEPGLRGSHFLAEEDVEINDVDDPENEELTDMLR